MSGSTLGRLLSSRRADCEEMEAGAGPLAWSGGPDDGVIEGPLDLASFAGRSLQLRLETGHLALLTLDGELRAALLDGGHLLRIGEEAGDVPPGARLLFLDTERPLAVRWSGAALTGEADLRVADPALFFNAFLRHAEEVGEPFIRRVAATLLQDRLARWLDGQAAAAPAPGVSLPAVTPALVAPWLAAVGLACETIVCRAPARFMAQRAATTTSSAEPVHAAT